MRVTTATTTTPTSDDIAAIATSASATSSSFATTTGRHYRPVPRGVRANYYRGGYLPVGWRTRVVPVPVYYEPQFVPVPYGYRRGFIDGHVVVHNSNGFILDIAAVF